jgi:hypothetical protein
MFLGVTSLCLNSSGARALRMLWKTIYVVKNLHVLFEFIIHVTIESYLWNPGTVWLGFEFLKGRLSNHFSLRVS